MNKQIERDLFSVLIINERYYNFIASYFLKQIQDLYNFKPYECGYNFSNFIIIFIYFNIRNKFAVLSVPNFTLVLYFLI